jgi:hexosaminidase
MMAYYKLNVLHLHLTDDQGWRVEIKKYPLLTEKGSIRKATQLDQWGRMEDKPYGAGLYYTQEQLKELVEYALEKNVMIMPEFDLPGHLLSAISCYPELSCDGQETDIRVKVGVEDKICCAGSEEFRTFIKDVIDELTELFPYPYFHIGGDEVPKSEWKKCPKCQGEIKSKGLKNENHLQGYLTNEVAEYLKSKGKRTIIWDERLGVNYNPDIILQWWRGEKRKAQSLDRIKNKENVIVSYCPYFYFDYPYVNVPLNKTYSFEPEVLKVKGEYSRYIMGLESCLWTEW